MKYVKYIITVMLVFLGILLSDSLYQFEITGIGTGAYAEFSNLDKETIASRLTRVTDACDEENLNFFIVDTVSTDDLNLEITLYSDEEIQNDFIRKGYYACDFVTLSGYKIHFDYGSWEDYLNRDTVTPANTIYFIDYDESRIENDKLKAEIYLTDYENEIPVKWIFLGLWSVIFCVILLFTGIDAFFSKKEWIVKIYHGWSLQNLLLSKLLINMLLNAVIVGGLLLAFYHFHVLDFSRASFAIPFVVFLILECMIYTISISKIDYKAVLGKNCESGKILWLSYAMGGVSLCMLIMAANFCCGQFQTLYPLLKEATFYDEFKGTYHVQPIVDISDEYDENGSPYGKTSDFIIPDDLYQKQIDQWNICMWTGERYGVFDPDSGMEYDCSTIWANKNAEYLIKRYVTEYADFQFNSDICYVLIPKQKQDLEQDILSWIEMNVAECDNLKVLYYQQNATVLAFCGLGDDGLSDTEKFVNPIIVFENDEVPKISEYVSYNLPPMAINSDSEIFIAECEKYDEVIRVDYTDIYGNYENRVKTQMQNLISVIIMFVLAIVTEIIVTWMVIRNEHEMKSMEICIQKINGTPLIIRYAGMFDVMIFSTIISCVISELVIYVQSQKFTLTVLPVGLACMFVEILFFSLQAIKWEKKSINKILKGGAL